MFIRLTSPAVVRALVYPTTSPSRNGSCLVDPVDQTIYLFPVHVPQRFVLKLIRPLYERLGFDERPTDSHLDHDTRGSLIHWACEMGHADCLKKSVEKFRAWMAEPENPR